MARNTTLPMLLCPPGRVQVLSEGSSGYVERAVPQENSVLILAILAFGMIVGWLAQLVLGMGTRPNAQSLIAGLVGSFVGGLLASLIAGDGLADPAQRTDRILRRRHRRAVDLACGGLPLCQVLTDRSRHRR